jgi:hypothetical protein
MSQSPPSPPPLKPDPQRPQNQPREIGDLGAPQKIFDTVAGPNLRLRDNLIQLVSVVAAIPVAFLITWLISGDPKLAIVLGVLGGLIGGVLISGAALGVYRFVKGIQR